MSIDVEKCAKCKRPKKQSDAWFRNLHEDYDLVCWSCHRDLSLAEQEAFDELEEEEA